MAQRAFVNALSTLFPVDKFRQYFFVTQDTVEDYTTLPTFDEWFDNNTENIEHSFTFSIKGYMQFPTGINRWRGFGWRSANGHYAWIIIFTFGGIFYLRRWVASQNSFHIYTLDNTDIAPT